MPRQARKKSSSGIYHIMLRGINKQQIFEDEEDYEKFLWVIKDTKELSGYKLFAYCLMGNHIHLLIKEEKEPLEQIFKRIGGKFVYWYNIKYQRVGHLFQDRFKSEPVEDDAYFLTVLRYIHQNPVKGNLCENVEDYKFSSYREYTDREWMVDTDFALGIMPLDEFAAFNHEENKDKCLEMEDKTQIRMTDKQARENIIKISNCFSVADFERLSSEKKQMYISKFKQAGISIRQICRLTGVSYYTVQKTD
ncbi:MAG: transposase [Ruminococcaceae bacterium]|nr:transposase [Oscillospiraceae bacterium]